MLRASIHTEWHLQYMSAAAAAVHSRLAGIVSSSFSAAPHLVDLHSLLWSAVLALKELPGGVGADGDSTQIWGWQASANLLEDRAERCVPWTILLT